MITDPTTGEAPPPPPADDAPQIEHDRYWLTHVYQADRTAQMTFRALLTGCFIGGIMSFSNLYVGLKTGWGLGASITAAILAFAFFTVWQKAIGTPKDKLFTVLENNTMQTAASSAAYMTSAGLVSAIPALYMTTGQALTLGQTMVWIVGVSCVGVVAAIPVKRKLINQERLRFPSGVACAETLNSLHDHSGDGILKAKALAVSGLLAGTLAVLKEGFHLIPGSFAIFGDRVAKWTVSLGGDIWTLGAGALMGMRVTTSMAIAAAVTWAWGPEWLFDAGFITCGKLPASGICEIGDIGYRDITGWTLWPGVALMVAHSLVGLSLQAPKIIRGLSKTFGKSGEESVDDAEIRERLKSIEIPMKWFGIGLILAGGLSIFLQKTFFDIPILYGILSVALAIVLAFVAARATGETDITPVGAMGKVTQVVFGGLLKGQIAPNLMAASVTGGAASQVGDLMTDMKTGYLLGAKPRYQFVAQVAGIIVGSIFASLAYTMIVDPADLGGEVWPAPAAMVWAKVAELLSGGLENIEWHKQSAIGYGLLVGGIFATLEHFIPKVKKYVPSITGVGIAMMVPFVYSFNMWLGALAALVLGKVAPKWTAAFLVVVASGLIAGETLMGVAVKMWEIVAPMIGLD